MNLILYGSLLNKDELKKQNIDLESIKYVKVYGFKRVFNQLPSWRKVDGNKKAVMNVEYDESSWFNAILLENLSDEYIKDLDERERGYDRISIKDGDVITYDGIIIKNCIIYKGKSGKQDDTILPNPTYFEICKSGAKSHFKEFYVDYLNTTYKNSDKGLVPI